MPLSKTQLSFLIKLTHELEPVVWIGQNGLTENVMNEIITSLDHHELIKIKIRVGDRKLRDQLADEMVKKTDAEPVQKIGNILVVYKKSKKEKIKLPIR